MKPHPDRAMLEALQDAVEAELKRIRAPSPADRDIKREKSCSIKHPLNGLMK